MNPRKGRPRIENPKNEKIVVRFGAEEKAILEKFCRQENVRKSEALRIGIRKLKENIKKE